MKKRILIALIAIILIISIIALFMKTRNAENFESYKKPQTISRKAALKLITVPSLCQYPTLPTGCEATAATMVLQYYGETISAEIFAEQYLECNNEFISDNGIKYGPDPNRVFVGDPFSENSYGCFAQPIADATNRIGRNIQAEIITNQTLEDLCKNYIDRDIPLLIWATMGMKKPKTGDSWHLDDETEFTWPAGEHCLVLVGYDDSFYYFNDPQIGDTVGFSKSISEQRFSSLGSQVVLISKHN